MSTEEFINAIEYSPYFAGLEGKTPEQEEVLENRIEQLPEAVKEFLFAPETSDGIQQALAQGGVSDDYATAVAKIVFLILMGDIPSTSIQQLLEKLDIPSANAQQVAGALDALLSPIRAAKTSTSPQPPTAKEKKTAPREIPPLSHSPVVETESVKPPQANTGQSTGNGSRQNGSRTIIDLRKKQNE